MSQRKEKRVQLTNRRENDELRNELLIKEGLKRDWDWEKRHNEFNSIFFIYKCTFIVFERSNSRICTIKL